jgi:hypothetical protein
VLAYANYVTDIEMRRKCKLKCQKCSGTFALTNTFTLKATLLSIGQQMTLLQTQFWYLFSLIDMSICPTCSTTDSVHWNILNVHIYIRTIDVKENKLFAVNLRTIMQ